MTTVFVKIEASTIQDWESFHEVFAGVMGFPNFYGGIMNAWIDCMSYLDDPETGMTKFFVASDEICMIDFLSSEDFMKRLPEIFSALVECAAAVNQRARESGRSPLLALAFS